MLQGTVWDLTIMTESAREGQETGKEENGQEPDRKRGGGKKRCHRLAKRE